MPFPIRKFLSYYRPHLRLFIAVLLCAILVSGISLAVPLLVRELTRQAMSGAGAALTGEMLRLGGLMLGLILLQNLGGYFVDSKGHEVGAFVILMTIDVPLTLTVFAFLPLLAVMTLFFNKKLNRTLLHNKERIADVNAQAEDSLAGIRVVQAFGGEQAEADKFGQTNRRFFESRKKTYRAEAVFYNAFETILQTLTVAAVAVGSLRISGSRMDAADLLAFLLYIVYLTEPIQRLAHMSGQLQEGVTGFQRFMEIMNTRPSIESPSDARRLEHAAGRIEFRDVEFRYAGREDRVLSGLWLTIEPGEYVALVGPSGSGKTTLCSLIPRFYDADAGQVLVDGVDVRELDLGSLRRAVGMVQQEMYLFDGTIEDNIRYGRPDAEPREVEAAARSAGAHAFIRKLPDGYRTEIGQRGVRLSGGQKQRLCIARLFLQDPPVLILDEATSALDNASEAAVKRALDKLAAGRTALVVAHRLSTIREAGRIVVLTDDGIAEQGTHDELLARGGVYAKLHARSFE